MANRLNKFFDGLIVRLATYASALHDHEGAIWLEDDSGNRLKVYSNSAKREFTTNDETQTLTSKVLTGNTAANLSPDGVETLTMPVATDTLVGKATTDSFSNKTIGDGNTINAQDDAFTIDDAADSSLQIDFNAAGTTSTKTTITSSQTTNRVVTIPDATDTLLGKATTDVLTNKTYDADAAGNTLSNVDNANIKAAAAIDAAKLADGTVSNAEFQRINSLSSNAQDQIDAKASSSDLTTHEADTTTHGATTAIVGVDDSQILTNKTLSGNTAANLSPDGAETLTLPVATDTLVGKATTDDLTNKTVTSGSIVTPSRLDVKQDTKANLFTYAGSASNGQLCFATDEKKMYQVVDSALVAVGGGTEGDADTIHLIRAADLNAVGDIDLTGQNADFDGGGTITASSLTLSTTAGDLILDDKVISYVPAANGQNDYFGFTKDIPLGLRGRSLGFAFEYKNDSTVVDNDFRFCVKIKDGTQAGAIEYFNMEAFSSNDNSIKFTTDSFIPNDCTAIEFGWQNTDTTTTVELFVDNIEVSASAGVYRDLINQSRITVHTGNGFGSSGTKIRRFTTIQDTIGSDIVYADSATNGASFTAVKKGWYAISLTDYSGVASILGISKDASNLTTAIQSLAADEILAMEQLDTGALVGNASWQGELDAGVVIRPHSNGSAGGTTTYGRMTVSCITETEHVITPAKSGTEVYRADTHPGYGSNNTKVPRFTNVRTDTTDTLISVTDTSTDGLEITVLKDCILEGHWSVRGVVGGRAQAGFSVDVAENVTTGIKTTPNINILDFAETANPVAVASQAHSSFSESFVAGQIIRPHSEGGTPDDLDNSYLTITARPKEATFLAAIPVQKTVYIKDVKSSGTNGGTSSTNTVHTRVLNTVEGDSEIVTLSSNQFTLGTGKYEIEASATYYRGASSMLFLYDVDNTDYVIDGQNSQATAANFVGVSAILAGQIEITSPTQYELRHWIETGLASVGLGVTTTATNNPKSGETYATVKITKIK